MTHSLSTHGALTEDARKTMSGKGREGNKEGKGKRVETSHPFSPNVSARAATEPSDAHQPHATTTAWMRTDR